MMPISFKPIRFGQSSGSPKPAWHKLNPVDRAEVERGELKGTVEVLVRLDKSVQLSQADTLKKLKDAGMKARFSAGHMIDGVSVSSGTIDAANLKALHDLDFVKKIEIYRPLPS